MQKHKPDLQMLSLVRASSLIPWVYSKIERRKKHITFVGVNSQIDAKQKSVIVNNCLTCLIMVSMDVINGQKRPKMNDYTPAAIFVMVVMTIDMSYLCSV